METEQDPLVYSQAEPDIAELIKEYQRCSPYAYGWNRLRDNEDIRFARWDGQNSDGKKHDTEDKEAFPWDGASDSQVFLADSVINYNVAIKVTAFKRSVALAKGVEPSDFEVAAYRTKLLEWLTGTKLKAELQEAVELAAQFQDTYGVFVLHPTWEREVKLKGDKITLEKLAEIASQTPGSPLEMLVQLIANEETEEQAIALVQEYGKAIAQSAAKQALGDDQSDLFDNYKVKPKTARRFVRELREGKVSSLPIPYICKNQPRLQTLKLWEDVFIPPYVTDIQEAPYVFVKHVMSEQLLRSRAAVDGWDQEWVEQAVARKGKISTWTSSSAESSVLTIGSTSETTATWLEPDSTQHSLIEVIYAYTQELDDDDIPCIYYTIFHADISTTKDGTTPLYAKRAKLEYSHNQMPFVVGVRERWDKSITSSRGIPQMLASRQREIKVQRDSLVDATSIGTIPPINVYANAPGANFKFGPMVRNMVLPGREPKALEIPMRETTAFALMEAFGREVKEEQGIPSDTVSPILVQLKQQMMVDSILTTFTLAFQQMFALVEQYMPDEMFMEITGSPQPLPKGELIALQKDFILSFDVREMDVEHIVKEFKAIAEHVLPHDNEGVISRAKLVRVMLRAINPSLAKEITLDGNNASQQLIERVENDFVRMFAGMEPRLTPDDHPTAQSELQIAQGILQQNAKIQQATQQDKDFMEKLQKWFKNREFNIQQGQNKQTGRMGVAA
jgi:hypothetical protein